MQSLFAREIIPHALMQYGKMFLFSGMLVAFLGILPVLPYALSTHMAGHPVSEVSFGLYLGTLSFIVAFCTYREWRIWRDGKPLMMVPGIFGNEHLPLMQITMSRILISDLSRKARLRKVPKFGIITDPSLANVVSAFVFPLRSAGIAATIPFLARATVEMLRWTYAHEISHLRNRDWIFFALQRVVLAPINASPFCCSSLFAAAVLGLLPTDDAPFFALTFLLFTPLRIAAALTAAAQSRSSEYLADAGAVSLIGWQNRGEYARVLQQLCADEVETSRGDFVRFIDACFHTHPSLSARISAFKIS